MYIKNFIIFHDLPGFSSGAAAWVFVKIISPKNFEGLEGKNITTILQLSIVALKFRCNFKNWNQKIPR